MPDDIPEPVQEGAAEVTYETLGYLVQRFHNHTQAILVHRIQTTEGVQREQGHRIVGVESAVTALTKRVAELERDNQRLRGTAKTPIIAPTIPPSPDYTSVSPDYSPASEIESDPYEDPSSGHTPPLPAISPFLSSDDDTTDSDTPNIPPSPTHDTPFTEITASTQRSPVIPRRQVMILAPGQLSRMVDRTATILMGRHSLSDHSSPDLLSTSARLSRKRCRYPMTSIPGLPLVSGALSPICADLIPSPKRVRDIGYLTDVEVSPRETRVERVTHLAMPDDIPEPV
nr:hypothetical protein [Tanacetum cinerariifolium]